MDEDLEGQLLRARGRKDVERSRGRSGRGDFVLVMAALHSRCGHYIFALWFLLSSFFLACHTCTHGVALDKNCGASEC